MNLGALAFINQNCEEILDQAAKENSVSEKMVKGIALFVVSNGYDKLTSDQKFRFDQVIRPLVEGVQCSGYTHELEEEHEECNSILDEDVLVEYYRSGGAYCDRCQGQSDADAHTKESFMRN